MESGTRRRQALMGDGYHKSDVVKLLREKGSTLHGV